MVLAAGKMYRPTDVAFDTIGNSVYVVEQFNHRVSKWDYTPGAYTFTIDGSWGTNSDGTTGNPGPIGDGGPSDTSFYRPSGIVFDGALLYVTDTFHNRVRVITAATGAFTESFGTGGRGDGELYHPAGILADENQQILIADEFNHRVVRFDISGTPAFAGIITESTPLPFNRPHGAGYNFELARSLFSDLIQGVVNEYDSATDPVQQFQSGQPGTELPVELFYPGSGSGGSLTSTTYFTDTRNNKLKSFNAGTIADQVGSPGRDNGEFYWPENSASFVDSVDYILVADTYNNRIQVFDQSGTPIFQSTFGSP